MRRFFVFIALTLTILMTGSALAAPPRADEPPAYDLALTTLTVSPASPRAGDDVTFNVAYVNQGAAPMPQAITATFTVTVTTMGAVAETPQTIGKPCAEVVSLVAGLNAGASNSHAFTTCGFKFPLEGRYRLTAVAQLVDANQAPLPDPAANNTVVVEGFAVAPYQTVLPDQFARLFAGLGMFMAVMAIMALGTEAVIDSVKVALGLKSKINVLEALKDTEKMLPGQLASLGVGATQQQQLTKLTSDLSATLEPATDFAGQLATLQKGDFQPVYDAILEAAKNSPVTPDERLKALKTAAGQALTGLDVSARRLGLDAEVSAALKKTLEDRLNLITVGDVQPFAEQVFKELQAVAKEMPDKWLEAQRDAVVTNSHTEISALFKQQVKPVLEWTGLSADTINTMTDKFEASLALINTEAIAATDTYIAGLRNLLNGVQMRRNDTQSPLRKLWRRLRSAQFADLVVCLGAGLVTGAFLWLNALWSGQRVVKAALPGVPEWVELQPAVFALIWGVLAFLLVGLALLVFGWLGKCMYTRHLQHHEVTEPEARRLRLQYITDGQVNRFSRLHLTELLWNLLRGSDTVIDPENFGDEDSIELLLDSDLTATNAAQVILRLTDQQRDEEDSRLRVLRLISVLVGLGLAYLLQVDAAVLLEAAIPGVSRSINLIVLTGEQLHHFWPILRPELNLTPGIFLTALAASAGSTFWHDQLDRLQAAKKQAEGVAQALQQVKELTARE